jgi:hypothetical protein
MTYEILLGLKPARVGAENSILKSVNNAIVSRKIPDDTGIQQ